MDLIFKVHCFLNKHIKYAYQTNTENTSGFWTNEQRNTHQTCESLANSLVEYYKEKNASSVIDLGCGNGDYVNYLNLNGVKAYGVDMNTSLEQPTFFKYNLSEPFIHIADFVQSFEVGEHIPVEYMNVFINNICNNARHGIVMSWAVEGQGGDGHVNELPVEKVISLVEKKGFKLNKKKTLWIRENIDYDMRFIYFKHNLLIFDKIKKKL
jgi:SAM-dependent methyltransferase